MKKRHAYALAAGLAIGNLFGATAQAQTQPDPADAWKADPFACLKAPQGHIPYCPNTAGKFLSARSALSGMQWADASNFMEQLTQIDRTTPEIQEFALRAAVLAGRFSLADDHVSLLSRLDPRNPLAALVTAATLVKSGDAAAAIETLQAARRDNSTDSLFVRLALRFYVEGQFNRNADDTDAWIFSGALYHALNEGLTGTVRELAGKGKYTEANRLIESMPQYQTLTLELCLQANPEDTSPLFQLFTGAKARGDYEAALHYLDRYPHGDNTPAIFQAAAQVLVLMGEKEAALQNLKAAAAYFTEKESRGKELTETDRAVRKLINEDMERLQKELAPSVPKPPAP